MESWLEFVSSKTIPKGNTYSRCKALFPNLRVPRHAWTDLKANQPPDIQERRIEKWHHFSDAILIAFFILSRLDLAQVEWYLNFVCSSVLRLPQFSLLCRSLALQTTPYVTFAWKDKTRRMDEVCERLSFHDKPRSLKPPFAPFWPTFGKNLLRNWLHCVTKSRSADHQWDWFATCDK